MSSSDHQQHYDPHAEPPLHQLHSANSPEKVVRDTPPGAATEVPDDPDRARMYKLLGAKLKCTLSDGRTATGTFICIDRLSNMILMDVLEERVIDPKDYDASRPSKKVPVSRDLQQAMIPGKHLVKVEIAREELDKRMTKEEQEEEWRKIRESQQQGEDDNVDELKVESNHSNNTNSTSSSQVRLREEPPDLIGRDKKQTDNNKNGEEQQNGKNEEPQNDNKEGQQENNKHEEQQDNKEEQQEE